MQKIDFSSEGNVIKGYFFPAAGDPPLATALFLQGFPGIEGDELICQLLADSRVNLLTFNYRGTFQSEGDFSFSNALADIDAALAYLEVPQIRETCRISPDEIVLGGWSFGSGLVPAAAARHPEIRKLFAISGRDFGHEARRIAEDPDYAENVRQNLEGIRAPRGPVRFRDDLLEDLVQNQNNLDISELVPRLRDRDILLLGGRLDQVSAVEDHLLPLHRSLQELGAKVRIEIFPDDHEFSATRDDLAAAIADWLWSWS